MKKNYTLIIVVIVAIVVIVIVYFFSKRGGWKKDESGQWQRVGDPAKEVPRNVIEDCFNNVGNLGAGLVVGDCQKRLCHRDDKHCQQRITAIFGELTK